MADADFYIAQGDTSSPLQDTLRDNDGNPVDISGATIHLTLTPVAGGAPIVDAAAANDQNGDGGDGSLGNVSYSWQTGDTDTSGFYLGRWTGHFSNGIQSFPNDGYLLVYITPAAPISAGQLYVQAEEVKATLTLTGYSYADETITAAIPAACRAIDNLCNRRFYLDADATQVRYYTPAEKWQLEIDDLVEMSAFATDEDGTLTYANAWTRNVDYVLEPLNAAADGWPYTHIRVLPTGSWQFYYRMPRSVRVTGQFGWAAVPDGIHEAALMLTSKLVKAAREAPFGIAQFGDAAIRISRYDPVLSGLIDYYRRHRIAVG